MHLRTLPRWAFGWPGPTTCIQWSDRPRAPGPRAGVKSQGCAPEDRTRMAGVHMPLDLNNLPGPGRVTRLLCTAGR
jgi:hypothetical protein